MNKNKKRLDDENISPMLKDFKTNDKDGFLIKRDYGEEKRIPITTESIYTAEKFPISIKNWGTNQQEKTKTFTNCLLGDVVLDKPINSPRSHYNKTNDYRGDEGHFYNTPQVKSSKNEDFRINRNQSEKKTRLSTETSG